MNKIVKCVIGVAFGAVMAGAGYVTGRAVSKHENDSLRELLDQLVYNDSKKNAPETTVVEEPIEEIKTKIEESNKQLVENAASFVAPKNAEYVAYPVDGDIPIPPWWENCTNQTPRVNAQEDIYYTASALVDEYNKVEYEPPFAIVNKNDFYNEESFGCKHIFYHREDDTYTDEGFNQISLDDVHSKIGYTWDKYIDCVLENCAIIRNPKDKSDYIVHYVYDSMDDYDETAVAYDYTTAPVPVKEDTNDRLVHDED